MPIPKKGESQEDFVKRCIPHVMGEGSAENNKQAYAMCVELYKKSPDSSGMSSDSAQRNIGFDHRV